MGVSATFLIKRYFMKKLSLIELLHRYVPSYPEEREDKVEIVKFLENEPDAFERTLEKGHITASAWLLSKDGKSALLMLHTKLNKWLQLGGHCDGDKDVLSVAIKEAQEESGIEDIVPLSTDIFDIGIHLIPDNNKGEKEHVHYDIRFLLQVASDEKVIQNAESKELRWVDMNIKNLPTEEPSIVRMVQKWQKITLRP